MDHHEKKPVGRTLNAFGGAAKQALNLMVSALIGDTIDYPDEYDRARRLTW